MSWIKDILKSLKVHRLMEAPLSIRLTHAWGVDPPYYYIEYSTHLLMGERVWRKLLYWDTDLGYEERWDEVNEELEIVEELAKTFKTKEDIDAYYAAEKVKEQAYLNEKAAEEAKRDAIIKEKIIL